MIHFVVAYDTYCTLVRGPIERVDNISPASVQLSLSQDKYKIIWNIGQWELYFTIYSLQFIGIYRPEISYQESRVVLTSYGTFS